MADYDVTHFGAVPGGSHGATDTIQRAINAASQAGGGRVVLPAAETPYRITGSLRITAGSITLSGKGATVLLADHVPIGDQDPVILRAKRIRANGAGDVVALSGVVSEQGVIEIEGEGGDVRLADGKVATPRC